MSKAKILTDGSSTEMSETQTTSESSSGQAGHDDDNTAIAKTTASCDETIISTGATASAEASVGPPSLRFNLESHEFECAFEGCGRCCTSADGESLVCPGCGPYSAVRFCGRKHLLSGTREHWITCGRAVLGHPCDGTLPSRWAAGPPMLMNTANWDTPERHRQNLWHMIAHEDGDYFIFTDWLQHLAHHIDPPRDWGVMTPLRCKGQVIHTVRFEGELKDRFNRLKNIALYDAIANPSAITFMFRMIRDNLKALGRWLPATENCVIYQFWHEFGAPISTKSPLATASANNQMKFWQAPQVDIFDMTDRHACELEWHGLDAGDLCDSGKCKREIAAEPTRGGGVLYLPKGLRAILEGYEAQRWILRAHRRHHPIVHDMEARIRGEGFDNIFETDRRLFRRGEAWDGFGSGPIEQEGINC